MTTQLALSLEQIARYRASAIERQRREEIENVDRRQKAWRIAHEAAQLLRQRFSASRVVVFGSLARQTGFNRWSDVDIAAWGIAPEDTFRAIGAVMDIQTEIPVNLVDVNTARPSLLASIERDGISI
jgi:uncharacterized protein